MTPMVNFDFHNSPPLKLSGEFSSSKSEMSAVASFRISPRNHMVSLIYPIPPTTLTRISFSFSCTSALDKFLSCHHGLSSLSARRETLVYSKSSEEAEVSETEDEWLQRLPDKKKPLYSHSLPCVEAWLRSLGFYQSKDDRAVWFVEKAGWHAHLSLDVTDLYIRYLKSGPGNLEKDVERRFSYALSREDIENAILGGP